MGIRIRTERRQSEEAGEQDRISAAIKTMEQRGLWSIALSAAHKHGMQPRSIFDVNHHTRPARGEAWIGMIAKRVTPGEIALWWGMTQGRVSACLEAYKRNAGYVLLRRSNDDETTPRMVAGYGDRRDDCVRYEECLGEVSKGYGGHARCPRQCEGYAKARFDVMDFVRAKSASDKHAAPTKGGWNSG